MVITTWKALAIFFIVAGLGAALIWNASNKWPIESNNSQVHQKSLNGGEKRVVRSCRDVGGTCKGSTPVECLKDWLVNETGCLGQKYVNDHFSNFKANHPNSGYSGSYNPNWDVSFDYKIGENILPSKANLIQVSAANEFAIDGYTGPLREYQTIISRDEALKKIGGDPQLHVMDQYIANPHYYGNGSKATYDNGYFIPTEGSYAGSLRWSDASNHSCQPRSDVDAETGELVPGQTQCAAKPVIYLYPPEKEKISVKVNPIGRMTKTDPDYGNGWNVIADPLSQIKNLADGKNYPYLFWEAEKADSYQAPKKGFVVERANLENFLNEKLRALGLTGKEIADFKEFWLPKMLSENKPYYFITFVPQSEIDQLAPLEIDPKPDTVIRVLMDYQALDRKIDVTELEIQTPERKGFAVVEWGGMLK